MLSDIKLHSLIDELSTKKQLFFDHAYDPILLHQAERSYYGGSCFLDKSFHNILLSLRWAAVPATFSSIAFCLLSLCSTPVVLLSLRWAALPAKISSIIFCLLSTRLSVFVSLFF